MLNAYQRRLLLSYIANAAERLGRRHPVAHELVTWVVEHGRLFDFDPVRNAPRRRRRWEPMDDEHRLTKRVWADFRESLQGRIRAAGNPAPDLTARRLGRLAAMTPISATDVRILECLLLCETNRLVERMVDDNFSDMQRRSQFNAGHSPLSWRPPPPILRGPDRTNGRRC